MYLPDYSITNKILKNISSIEYSRAVIENKAILSAWEDRLEKDAKIRLIHFLCLLQGKVYGEELVKKFVDGLLRTPPELIGNIFDCLELVEKLSKTSSLSSEDIKGIHNLVSKDLLPKNRRGVFRSSRDKDGSEPEEILAEMTALVDWYNSQDAKETHPVIVSGIMRAGILRIVPFGETNTAVASMVSYFALRSLGYGIKRSYALEGYFAVNGSEYAKAVSTLKNDDGDLSRWLEFYTAAFARELVNVKEKVELLARDTKVAAATGRANLSSRQEKIIEYIQDYGLLQNSDFPNLFPKISEDTVLREIKGLMKKGLVVRRGKTKSARYEIK